VAWKIAERRAEKKKEKRDTAGAMSVVDHLKELRDRLVWSLLAIAIGAVVCFIFFEVIIDLLVEPYRDATVSPAYPDGKPLIFTHPLEAFATRVNTPADDSQGCGSLSTPTKQLQPGTSRARVTDTCRDRLNLQKLLVTALILPSVGEAGTGLAVGLRTRPRQEDGA